MTRTAARKSTTTTATPSLGVRVALYLRISTDEEHQPFSLEAQRLKLEQFVPTQPGWVHVATYEDRVSGAKASRPELDRAVRDARLGRFDVLLVYRVDRFARSLKVLVGLLEELEAAGVAFRSATEPIDTATATGRMLVQLLGVFAEFERATIIDRVVNGMERKAARGGWPGGRLPYGLRLDDDSRLATVDAEFATVERVFARYAGGSLGCTALAEELNADGLRTRSGKLWSRQVLLEMLRNRAYLGEVFFRGTWHRSAEQPFLDSETFDRVQALLAERGEGYGHRFRARDHEYLLTGLVRCGRCEHNYLGVSARGRSERYRYYTCWNRNRRGKRACEAESVRADALERAVLAALVDLYAEPQALLDTAARQRHDTSATTEQLERDTAAVEAELRKVEAAVERWMAGFEDGTLSADTFAGRVRELGGKAEQLRARHAELQAIAAAAHAGTTLPTVECITAVHRELVTVTATAPDELRKAVAQAFVHEVRVERKDLVLPTYRLLPGLPVTEAGEDPVRTMTGSVGVTGLEPVTSAV
jgi:site-specific DNA recombinase